MSREYVIIDADFVPSVDFAEVLETSEDTLRWNKDQTQTIVKYSGTKPAFLDGKTAITHSQMMTELEKPEWTGPRPE